MTSTFPISECKTCHAPIIWCLTRTATRMPVDAIPMGGGNVQLIDLGPQQPPEARVLNAAEQFGKQGTLRKSHHQTCPQGREWKRKR